LRCRLFFFSGEVAFLGAFGVLFTHSVVFLTEARAFFGKKALNLHTQSIFKVGRR